MTELLAEAEQEEHLQSEAYCDLTLLEIRELTDKITRTFEQAEEEQTLIQQWALNRTSKLQERIDFLSQKLRQFMTAHNERTGEKTIALPNGDLKIRKKQDKIEIEDLELFLQHATKEMLSVVPESAKPDIAGIKSYRKMTNGKAIPGIRVVTGHNEFSYKLKENTNGTDTTK